MLELKYVDISLLKDNPKNFYGVRDVEVLADQIAVSNYLEPLMVVEEIDHFVIISGHRRKAAIQKLLENGRWKGHSVPCIVLPAGCSDDLSQDQLRHLQLINANRGQRRRLSRQELLEEVNQLKSLARAMYEKADIGARGKFRQYFANFLGVSESRLQRLQQYQNLTPEVQDAIEDGTITEQNALRMAKTKLGADKQNAVIAAAKAQHRQVSEADIEIVYRESESAMDNESDGQTRARNWIYEECIKFLQNLQQQVQIQMKNRRGDKDLEFRLQEIEGIEEQLNNYKKTTKNKL